MDEIDMLLSGRVMGDGVGRSREGRNAGRRGGPRDDDGWDPFCACGICGDEGGGGI